MTDSRQPKPPKTKARLEQLITQWQKGLGQPVGRLNLRIAAMMLAGTLARVTAADGEGVVLVHLIKHWAKSLAQPG